MSDKIIKRHSDSCVECESNEEEFNRDTDFYLDAIRKALETTPLKNLDGDAAVNVVPLIRALTTIAASCLMHIPDDDMRAGACEASVKTLAHGGGDPFKRHVSETVAHMRDDMESRCNVAGFSRPLSRKDYN